jgi:mRNA interferase HicA
MKRVDLIRHLKRCGCEFLREGDNHTIYVNRSARKSSSVPRHRDVNDFLAGEAFGRGLTLPNGRDSDSPKSWSWGCSSASRTNSL